MPANPTADLEAETSVAYELTGRDEPLTRDALFAALRQLSKERVTAAIDSLVAAGVLRLDAGTIEASEALKRLDALGMIDV